MKIKTLKSTRNYIFRLIAQNINSINCKICDNISLHNLIWCNLLTTSLDNFWFAQEKVKIFMAPFSVIKLKTIKTIKCMIEASHLLGENICKHIKRGSAEFCWAIKQWNLLFTIYNKQPLVLKFLFMTALLSFLMFYTTNKDNSSVFIFIEILKVFFKFNCMHEKYKLIISSSYLQLSSFPIYKKCRIGSMKATGKPIRKLFLSKLLIVQTGNIS